MKSVTDAPSQGILKGVVSMYHWPPVWLVGISRFANKNKNCQLSYSWFQTSQTGGQQYSDPSPFSVPCPSYQTRVFAGSKIFWQSPASSGLCSSSLKKYCFFILGHMLTSPTSNFHSLPNRLPSPSPANTLYSDLVWIDATYTQPRTSNVKLTCYKVK